MRSFVIVCCSAVLFCLFTALSPTSMSRGRSSCFGNKKVLPLHSPLDLQSGVNHDENRSPIKEEDLHNSDWYSSAIKKISDQEYVITYDSEFHSYQSANRKNNIRFLYHNDGFTAKARETVISQPDVDDKKIAEIDKKHQTVHEWSAKLKVEGSKWKMEDKTLQVSGNKAWIENDNIRIDYTNTEDGMRQDFIVKQKPAGKDKLRLDLSAETELKMIIEADALMFKDKEGVKKMKYSSLKVWDANGKSLPAHFEKRDKSSNTNLQFSIVVDDKDAVYPVTIDPLSTSPNWVMEGDQTGANFGSSIATAGDVNGDGYSDIIIGSSNYDNGQSNEGKVFVYYGSAMGISSVPGWTAESNQVDAQFGYSVCTAGDVNGDGYSDVIVGAPFYDNTLSDEGKVFIYYGSPSGLSASANWTAVGLQNGTSFGASVSTAADVNNDGYGDVIIGSPFYDNGQINEGRVYAYYGTITGLPSSPNWTKESDQATSFFGIIVSSAGDLNGDGFSDVIVGSPYFDNGQTDEGKVFVFNGSASGLSATANWTSESNQISANYGNSLGTAGDVNGDGYSDVIIGAPLYDNVFADCGRAYVYLGSSTGLVASSHWSVTGTQAAEQFGHSVACAGDVNGDGYADIIAGAPYFANGSAGEGYAGIYFGSSAGLSVFSPSWSAEGEQTTANFGYCVATAGDVNGDGFSDFIIDAWRYHFGQTDEGKVFAYFGGASMLKQTSDWSKEGNQSNTHFADNIEPVGDVNGDWYSDFVLVAPDLDIGGGNKGIAYVYYGSQTGISTSADWSYAGLGGDQFVIDSKGVGDINGDGYSDIVLTMLDTNIYIMGYKLLISYGSFSGLSVPLAFGSYYIPSLDPFIYSPPPIVSPAGDVNGDGYGDFFYAAYDRDNNFALYGYSGIYYGSSVGITSYNRNSIFETPYNYSFGKQISSAGDVNGDGFSDILVASENRVHCYYGSSTGLPLYPNWTVTGIDPNSDFGSGLSCAGDVNGDGFSDILIGAPKFSNGQTKEGKVFLYYGSSSGLHSIENWSKEGNITNAYLGNDLSTAGDVNGDGYSDVLLTGNNKNVNFFGADTGRVYLFTGSPTGLPSTEDWQKIYPQYNLRAVTAGDVNGDGFSDIIVGVPYYSNGQINEGSAFSYYGNGGTGCKSIIQQFKPASNSIVSQHGFTGTNGNAKLSIFGKSPFGRANGKIVYEYKQNGLPFSGANISNNTSSSGEGNFSDMLLNGKDLSGDFSGLSVDKDYKWRSRVKYNLVKNPYQKFGPWKYYSNFYPVPYGSFKTQNNPVQKQLTLKCYLQGFYNAGTHSMIPDTLEVILYTITNSIYIQRETSRALLNSNGTATFNFYTVLNNYKFRIKVRHRNSISTFSSTGDIRFVNSFSNYDFSTNFSQAYGNNMIPVDISPISYAIYSGDVNQDGTVDATDVSTIDNDAANFVSGYVVTDLTGDNFVDGTDFAIADNNAANFVAVIQP